MGILEDYQQIIGSAAIGEVAATHQLARMIDDLLDAGRFDSGRFSLHRRSVDLHAIAANARAAAADAHPHHRFELCCGATSPLIMADAVRLDQVLRNLLANAARTRRPAPT